MPESPDTDQRLIFRVSVFQDQEAFVTLHNRYYPRIYKFIAYKIARPEDAEDLASQMFLEVWKYLTNTKKKKIQNLRAFLYKAARNTVAGFYRAQDKVPKTIDIDDLEGESELPDEREDTLSKQLSIQDADYLIECVQKLPEPYREVIALKFFDSSLKIE